MNLRNSDEYIINVELPIIIQNIEEYLRPQDRGFELLHSGAVPNYKPSILYQSKQCKIRISCKRDRPYEEVELLVNYGRLHAPLDKDIMEWNNERCWCWHRLDGSPLLFFLDRIAPSDVDKLITPRVSRDFIESSKNMEWTVSEHFARKHAIIWEHYNQRLFNLFDLDYQNIWEEYANFLKEYSRLRAEKGDSLERHFYGQFYDGERLPLRYNIC